MSARDLFASSVETELTTFALRRAVAAEISYFVIDGENRTITPPSDFKHFGVESDEDTTRVYFECPQYVGDGIDLTDMNITVNFKNANGEKDAYIVTDVEGDGNTIHFSWLLSRKVTKYKGTVQFIICAVKTNSQGVILKEWNTTLCSGDVLEGLEVELPSASENEYDVISQLLDISNTAKDTAERTQSAFLTFAGDVQSVFGTCFISQYVKGITVGMVISSKFPLTFTHWSAWLGDTKLNKADLGVSDPLITPPGVFENTSDEGEPIPVTVKFHTDKYNIVTTVNILQSNDVASWGTLQYEKTELN